MNDDNVIKQYVPSLLNPRTILKTRDIPLTQNSMISGYSLALKRPNGIPATKTKCLAEVKPYKENALNLTNQVKEPQTPKNKYVKNVDAAEYKSIGFSIIEDLTLEREYGSLPSSSEFQCSKPKNFEIGCTNNQSKETPLEDNSSSLRVSYNYCDKSHITISSANDFDDTDIKSEPANTFDAEKTTIKLSVGVNDCESVHFSTKNSTIKNFTISHRNSSTNIGCELIEGSQLSTEAVLDENMNEMSTSPQKRPIADVNLEVEIKKKKLTDNVRAENEKVLILNTDAIKQISDVIVQPPINIKLKRNIFNASFSNHRTGNAKLKQASLDRFIRKGTDATIDVSKHFGNVSNNGVEMSKNSSVLGVKCDQRVPGLSRKVNELPKSANLAIKSDISSKKGKVRGIHSDGQSPRNNSASHSPRVNESIHFSLPIKSKSNKSSLLPKVIPHHKIVAGTHFAVDAFSYGEIPNVTHYFLTHFHSDHYCGLKKGFNKLLYCSKITAELCTSRLGVNPKCIQVIDVNNTLHIEGVEVVALDANHCPGALMFAFTLPNGKTLLHTGDFRASPQMESYPVFWNKDIHTVYLDTTYCNPRYDFPTQDHSIEMALHILRQKKMALDKCGGKFANVLIVCGTYTIGKEKFFHGMARRVGCSVWACPEKERVLRVVEGTVDNRPPPQHCQIHVLPMRDLTHEKLGEYLASLRGAFSEVVAFKPSGWENRNSTALHTDTVTIHGIPYSEHSSFSELIRFVKFLQPKQVVPTVDILGGVKAVQKYFPCPLVSGVAGHSQARVTDYYSQNRPHSAAVT